jgi:hypothetical protein
MEYKPRMLDLDFEQVLGVLQAWMGKPIVVGIDAANEPFSTATMRGPLEQVTLYPGEY